MSAEREKAYKATYEEAMGMDDWALLDAIKKAEEKYNNAKRSTGRDKDYNQAVAEGMLNAYKDRYKRADERAVNVRIELPKIGDKFVNRSGEIVEVKSIIGNEDKTATASEPKVISEAKKIAERDAAAREESKKTENELKAKLKEAQDEIDNKAKAINSIDDIFVIYPSFVRTNGKIELVYNVSGTELDDNLIEKPKKFTKDGNYNRGGDLIAHSIEDAIQTAKEARKAYEDKISADEKRKADELKSKEDKDNADKELRAKYNGFISDATPLRASQVDKVLGKRYNWDDNTTSTLAERIGTKAKAGELTPSVSEEYKVKDVSRRKWNQMTGSEQREFEERQKREGKKLVYLLNGADYGKIAYDYANHILMQLNKDDIRFSKKEVSEIAEADKVTRNALVDVLNNEIGIYTSLDEEEGQMVLDEANGKVRKMSFGEAYDYDAYPLGRVEPNLAEKEVAVVEADVNHGFANYKEAKAWAKQHVSKMYTNEESGGKGDVRISNAAIDKFMSQSAIDKSDSKDVHMAVLKVLPDVLKSSIDVETHPDFLKGEDGKRRAENGMNKDVLVHRCYGAVSIDGKPYRVKITLKEEQRDVSFPHVTHSYEATKIELLAGQHGDVTMTSPRNSNSSKQVELPAGTWENQEGPSPNTNNSISATKLLENIGMSYNSDEKVLDASEKRSNDMRFFRTANGEVYGFTIGGKIYLDPRYAKPETPLHEYTHLWADMIRKVNPDAWNDIVKLMKGEKELWDYVSKKYPELDGDELVDEVLAHYSGKRGAERIKEEQEKIANDENIGVEDKANAISALEKIKAAVKNFWHSVAELLHIRFKKAEEVADRILADFLNGVNPITDVPKEKSLVGVHNISESKLKKAVKQGGLVNPSAAVIDLNKGGHSGYGEISLVMPKSLVDSKTGRNAGTFTGDAWTPTYPEVSIQDVDYEKADKEIDATVGDKEIATEVRRAFRNYVDSPNSDSGLASLSYWYLADKGINIEPKVYEGLDMSNPFEKAYSEIDNNKSFDRLLEEDKQKLIDVYVESGKGVRLEGKEKQEELDRIKKMLDNGEITPWKIKVYEKKYDEINKYGIGLTPIRHDYNELDYKKRLGGRMNVVGTTLEAFEYLQEQGFYNDFESWLADKIESLGGKEMLFKGYAYDGTRKYVPNTLENASAMMNAESEVNAYDNGGLSATRSLFLDKLSSLSDIRKNKELLGTDDVIKEKQKELSDELFAIISSIDAVQKVSDNQFMSIDYTEKRLQEALTKSNPVAYLEKEYGYKFRDKEALKERISNFIEEVKSLPSRYFETKFKRPVRLKEFAAAVVPEDASKDVIKELEDNGLKIFTYKRGDERDRKRALNEASNNDKIRFEKASDLRPKLMARLDGLAKASAVIKGWIKGGKRGKSFRIELPAATERMVRKAMGSDFDGHYITANGVAHAQRNHGVGGRKLSEGSIPLTDADMELIPYIMTAPDRVERGSSDVTGRESVRFYKTLSNGYVVVVEKEYKNSPNDMETITMWAEKSPAATNARSSKNAPNTHVQNAILSTDAVKIRKNAEKSYEKEETATEEGAGSEERYRMGDVDPNDREQRESEAENETGLSDEVYNSTVDELQKKFGDKIETISREDLPGDKKGSKTIKAVYDPSTGTIKVVRENYADANACVEYCPTIMVSTKLVIITPNCPSRSGNPNTRVEI